MFLVLVLVLFSALLLLFFLSCSIFVILECKNKMGLARVFDWAYKWGFFLRFVGFGCISVWAFVFVSIEFIFEIFFYV